MHSKNEQYVKTLQDAFAKSELAERIVSLIYHGSSMYKPLRIEASTDIDLELILSEPQPEDYAEIHAICSSLRIPVECQVRYMAELVGDKNVIRATSYKVFMWFAYANGTLLLGERNIFTSLVTTVTSKEIDRSLLICVQLAYKDIRKTFLAGKISATLKNIRVFLFDMLLFKKVFDIRELGSLEMYEAGETCYMSEILQTFPDILSDENKSILKSFAENALLPADLPKVMNIMDILYLHIL